MATGEGDDFGLGRIAKALGKDKALQLFWQAAAAEAAGNVRKCIDLYESAFILWPALDSRIVAGLPMCVREEATAAGLHCDLDLIDVKLARAARVVRAPKLLDKSGDDGTGDTNFGNASTHTLTPTMTLTL